MDFQRIELVEGKEGLYLFAFCSDRGNLKRYLLGKLGKEQKHMLSADGSLNYAYYDLE